VFLVVAWSSGTNRMAIVTAREASVRSGPLEEAQTAFTAHDGAELAILDAKDDWLQVNAGQRSGWVKRGQVVQFPLLQK